MTTSLALIDKKFLKKLIPNTSVLRHIENIYDRMTSAGASYIQCDFGYIGGGDIGRYCLYRGKRIILLATGYRSYSLSEYLDTMIHESIHFAGDQVLGRHHRCPITRNDRLYLAEEYIATRSAYIICQVIGINSLNPPPLLGPWLFNCARLDIMKMMHPEGIHILDDYSDAAIKHAIFGDLNKYKILDRALMSSWK